MKTSNELIKSVKEYKNGNSEAFNSVYEQSYAYLHTCVIHIVKDEDVAQDMIQDTYMEIIKNIGSLEKEESFLSWAAMIANRKCFARIKKNQELLVNDSEEEQSDYFENIADDEAFIPENVLDNQAKVEIIKGIIDELSDVQRACVIGFYYNEQKQDEIAEELGIPVNTVKSHLNRAKAKIKESVGETEKKQGIKLYSIAPFMLLFFTKEVKACELVPMSETLAEAGSASVNSGSVSKSVLGAKKVAGATKKIAGWKIGAIAGVVAVAGIVGIVATTNKDNGNDGAAEPIEQVAEVVEDKEEAFDDTSVDIVDEVEPEIELSDLEKEGLSYDVVYDGPLTITDARNGVAIAYDEDTMLGGMIRLDNQEILVPIEYSSASGSFSDDGTTYFTDGNVVRHIFNSDGAELYSTSNEIIGICDGYVTEVTENKGYVKSFKGDELYSCEYDMYKVNGGMVSFSEGYAYAISETHNAIERISKDGSVEAIIDPMNEERHSEKNPQPGMWVSDTSNVSMLSEYPYGMSSEGYVCYKGMEAFEDGWDKFSIYDTSGNCVGRFNVMEFLETKGFSGDYKYAVIRAFNNHGYIYNYGTKMVVKGRDDSKTRYYLVEVSGCNNGEVPAILFEADEIITSKEKYWLFNNGDKWGYVDHEGNVVGEYVDASEYSNGIAMIIQDGKAYFIDEELNLLGEGIEADGVSNCGDLFAVKQGESILYVGHANSMLSIGNDKSMVNIEKKEKDSDKEGTTFDKKEFSKGEIFDVDEAFNCFGTVEECFSSMMDHTTWDNYPIVSAGTILKSSDKKYYSLQIYIGDGYHDDDKYTYALMDGEIIVGDTMFDNAEESYKDWGISKEDINNYHWYICSGDMQGDACIVLICAEKK